MVDKFPNLGKERDIQVEEAQKVPNKIKPKRLTLRLTIIKIALVKKKILTAARE